MTYDEGYDEGYRAGMQKMREVGQARIDELEAKRQWVGLTIDDFDKMFVDVWLKRKRYAESDELRSFAGLIEAKLKEKNT